MKNTIKVSIAGISFVFADDAYKVMKDYIDRLEAYYYKKPDGREIIADMEGRIAELILNDQESEKTISKKLADSIIGQLGLPDDMDSIGDQTEKFPRRLYRDSNGAVFGGVCSGLGTYFNADPIWFRLGIFAPLLLGIIAASSNIIWDSEDFMFSMFGMFILLYFILWIAIPMAKTPRQKLEMRGEKITASSIRHSFEEEASASKSENPKREQSASVFADLIYAFGRIVLFFIKALVICVAAVFGMVIISLIIAIVAVSFGATFAISELTADGLWNIDMVGITPAVYTILILLAALIPFAAIGYLLIKLLFRSNTSKPFLTISGVIWLMIVAYLMVITVRNSDAIRDGVRNVIENVGTGWEKIEHDINDWDESGWKTKWNSVRIDTRQTTQPESSYVEESDAELTAEEETLANPGKEENITEKSEDPEKAAKEWDEGEWERKWNEM